MDYGDPPPKKYIKNKRACTESVGLWTVYKRRRGVRAECTEVSFRSWDIAKSIQEFPPPPPPKCLPEVFVQHVQRVFVVFQTFSASLGPCSLNRCPRWIPAGAVASSSGIAGPCCATGRNARGTTIWSALPVGSRSTGVTSTTSIYCAFIL